MATKTRTAGRRRRARINRALGKLESDERARERESDGDTASLSECDAASDRHEEFPRKGRKREGEREGERKEEGEREREREREGERERQREMGRRRRMKRHVGKVAREGRRHCRLVVNSRLTSDLISKASFQMLRFCVCIQDANATAQRRHIAGRDRLARGGRSKCRFWLLNGEDERREREREGEKRYSP